MIEILISLLISLTILVVVLFGLLAYSKKGDKKSEVILNIYNHNGECVISSKFESVEKAFEFLDKNLSSLKGMRYTIE